MSAPIHVIRVMWAQLCDMSAPFVQIKVRQILIFKLRLFDEPAITSHSTDNTCVLSHHTSSTRLYMMHGVVEGPRDVTVPSSGKIHCDMCGPRM